MSPKEWFGFALVAAVSGASSWLLSGQWHEARVADAPPAGRPDATPPAGSPAAAGAARLPIQFHPDGRVSLHLDHAPLDWVVQELERRQPSPAARSPVGASVVSSAEPVGCEAAEPAELSPQELETLQRHLRQGSDAERQAALVRASEAGVELPPALLRQLFESDPSEAVRLLAFTTYLDAVADDPVAMRAALDSGTYNHSAAVQQEARRRASEWAEMEATVAASPAQGTP
jgi:hypothetical protein